MKNCIYQEIFMTAKKEREPQTHCELIANTF